MIDDFLISQGIFLYLTLFFALMGGAVGLPIPEDIPLLAAGIAAQAGKGRIELLFLTCYFAVIIGDLIVYYIGRKLGPRLFQQKWFRKRHSESKVRRFRLRLEKRSLAMIFIARHLFYLRTVTFLTCGAVKMKATRFLMVDALAALISVPLMMTVGYFAAEHYDRVKTNIEIVALFLLLCLVGFVFYRYRKSKQQE